MTFAQENVNLFYDNLYALLSNNPEHFLDDSRIFNLDETGVHAVQTPKKMLAVKDIKNVHKMVSAERGSLVSMLFYCGKWSYITPMFLFP